MKLPNKKTSAEIFRQKQSEAKMKTIEKKYGKDFSVHGNENLGNFLEKKGYGSLSKFLSSSNAK